MNKRILQYIIFFLCIFFILKYLILHHNELSSLAHFNKIYIVEILMLGLLSHIIGSYKMYIILKNLGLKQLGSFEWLKIYTTSRLLNFNITQGGNIYRGLKLKKGYGFTYAKSLGMASFLSWFEMILILSTTAILLVTLNQNLILFGINTLYFISTLLILIIILPFSGKYILNRLHSKNEKILWIYGRLTDLMGSIVNCTKNYRFLAKISFLSIFSLFILNLQLFIFFKALSIHLNFAQIALFTSLTMVISIVNITPSNIGIAELLYGFLSQSLGQPLSAGIVASGVLRILMFFVTAIFAGILFIIKNNTYHSQSSKQH